MTLYTRRPTPSGEPIIRTRNLDGLALMEAVAAAKAELRIEGAVVSIIGRAVERWVYRDGDWRRA